ncbi:rhodanese-like domain-containing protein [Flavobacterium sp. TP390]|uniref:Rhodanese-like domain-containing protein n=1 Tax=Flavobacterium profundi TaxID=1774945 RepID=A0A6I4IJ90_9FLAO|nr:rhodanese-like domain-containing protein [Flavobacterium profundi]MVO07979.1 rhodanese-like domain-containing protein [Flavobacterium profundi]
MKSLFLMLLLFLQLSVAQKNIPEVLQKFNTNSVPYISAEELKSSKNSTVLDTRELEEFNVSHLENAIHVGYQKFDTDLLLKAIPNKQTPIVVYCSIGVRSEDIGEKLIQLGYTNVKNLYGGIFEWKNKNYTVVNANGEITDEVHAFSKTWGKYLLKGIKIYNQNKK